MYALIRPLLFTLDEERAHELTLSLLKNVPACFFAKPPATSPISALGLQFPHPVGLAAGLDKNGEYLEALSKLGFSFIEIGTVTPKAQAGNPKPRLFRLPKAKAIINRMGFNNAGVDVLVNNVKQSSYRGILGINIGKNKDTALNDAVNDYLYCLKKVYAHASYVTINISSPNTPGLRQLQEREYLSTLLTAMVKEQSILRDLHHKHVPLVIKISPDEAPESLKQIAEVVLQTGIEGIIATNTSFSREGVEGLPFADEQGGLSGAPLFSRSTDCLKQLKKEVGDKVTLIGVGGIDSAEKGCEKRLAGASLIQVYSGLVYQGASLIKDIVKKWHADTYQTR